MEIALENKDTALAKKFAQNELDEIRSSIKDPDFAATTDASLQIQKLQFALQKADSSRVGNKFSNEIVFTNQDGQKLYALMLNKYKHALEITSNADDVIYFTNEIALTPGEWLEQKFANKKTYEALISLDILQRDLALISAIENKIDTEQIRKDLQKSYQRTIDNMRKAYQ